MGGLCPIGSVRNEESQEGGTTRQEVTGLDGREHGSFSDHKGRYQIPCVLLRKKHNESGESPHNEGGGSGIDGRPRRRLAIVVALVVALIVAAVIAGELIRDAARWQSRRVGLGLRLNLSATDHDPLRDGGHAIDRDEEHCGNTSTASVIPATTRVASTRLDVLAGPGGNIAGLGGICEIWIVAVPSSRTVYERPSSTSRWLMLIAWVENPVRMTTALVLWMYVAGSLLRSCAVRVASQ